MTIVVLMPPVVTMTCIGKAPSGTADATNVLDSWIKRSHWGNGPPDIVVTETAAFWLVDSVTCGGKGKEKPDPAVAISRGTVTEMIPDSC
jgi:hypothetical protein